MIGHSTKSSIRIFQKKLDPPLLKLEEAGQKIFPEIFTFFSRLPFCFERCCTNKDAHSSPHCLLGEEFKLMNSTDDNINFNFLQRHAKNKFTNR